MASLTTRKSSEKRSTDLQAGSLASGLSIVIQARIRELVSHGMTYEQAERQSQLEIMGNLQASIDDVKRR